MGSAPSRPCELCFWLIYQPIEGLRVPLYNVVMGLFPFVFLFLLLLQASEANQASARARASTRLRNHQTRAEDMVRPAVVFDSAERSAPLSRSDTSSLYRLGQVRSGEQDAGDGIVGCGGRLLQRLHFSGAVLPQHFVLVRWLTQVDFAVVFFLLVASDPNTISFRTFALLLRLAYRWLEYLILFVLVAPFTRAVGDPRDLRFAWRFVLRAAAPLLALILALDFAGWLYMTVLPDGASASADHRWTTQFYLVVSAIEEGEAGKTTAQTVWRTYVKPLPADGAVSPLYAWAFFDALDGLVFALFAALPALSAALAARRARREAEEEGQQDTPGAATWGLRSSWTSLSLLTVHPLQFTKGGPVYFPRPALTVYATLLLLSRVLRLVGDGIAINDSRSECGGSYLCWWAAGYFLEQAMFAPALLWCLRLDSEVVYTAAGFAGNGNATGDERGSAGSAADRRSSVGGTAAGHLLQWSLASDLGDDQIVAADVWLGAPLGSGQLKVQAAQWLGSPVAVKRVPYAWLKGRAAGGTSAGFSARLQATVQEIHILRKCCHPNIVQYLGFCIDAAAPPRTRQERLLAMLDEGGEEGEQEERQRELWIVTELLERKSLFGLVGDPAVHLGLRTQLRMMIEMCRGMVFLHDVQGVLHRDLKSLNIFVSRDWHVKIGDFGESKVLGHYHGSARQPPPQASSQASPRASPQASLQASSQASSPQVSPQPGWKAYGSLEWMAPEVLSRSSPFSHASDVFSAAVVMWEVFERRRPYVELPMSEIQGAVVGGFRLPLTALTPPTVRALIERSWAEEPAARPSFAAIMVELQAVLAACEEVVAAAGSAKGEGRGSEAYYTSVGSAHSGTSVRPFDTQDDYDEQLAGGGGYAALE
jgi:hypothetical protein